MLKKEIARAARHKSIRKKITGTQDRPRLCVHRSLNHMYVQVIDDIQAKTICSVATSEKEFQKTVKGSKTVKADKLGEVFAGKLKSKGISKIAFDRAGYKYHGRVKALAESLRKAGIQF
ncbi:MAG: 50S ribosomal protein L18 [Candidatus Omnitrophica bacterium]|nr:50S ribosomal protein L18 [Candidatus Omnitrophota bacterium]